MATVAFERPNVPIAAGPIIICVAMLSCASVITSLGGPSFIPIAVRYVGASLAICVTSTFIWVFAQVWQLARVRADSPLKVVWARLQLRLPYMLLPGFVLPLFLAGYTAAKIAIPALVGFRFDAVLADLDMAMFGDDPWRYAHAFIGRVGTVLIELIYVHVWIAVLGYSKALVALFGSRRMIATFFTAMMLTWFVGGFLGAYLLSSAGPTFTQFNGMEWRFVQLKMDLLEMSGIDSPFVSGPGYLDAGSTTPLEGGGISAMPSMHMAACSIYVLAARGTRWFLPACLFWLIIFVGSIHSGYHYAVDAPMAAAIAFLCWRFSAKLYQSVEADDCAIDECVG